MRVTGGRPEARARLALLAASVAALAPIAGCETLAPPSVQYLGQDFGRKPKPVEMMQVHRAGPPPPRFQDLGTVVVTCPSEMMRAQTLFVPTTKAIGGCSYEWAVSQACERAAAAGGDGIHSIESSANSNGDVVSLRASVFVHLPPLAQPPAPPATPAPSAERPSIEDRLRRLEKLKTDQLITPEEYAKKRAEILGEI